MIEYTVGDERFRSGKIDTFTQAFIAKRLLRVAAALGPHAIRSGVEAAQRIAAAAANDGAEPAENAAPDFDPMEMLAPLADAIGGMHDEDIRYVFLECLKVTQRFNAGGWQPVWNRGANDLQFDDIGLLEMLWITFQAMGDNISSFTRGPLARLWASSPVGQQLQPS